MLHEKIYRVIVDDFPPFEVSYGRSLVGVIEEYGLSALSDGIDESCFKLQERSVQKITVALVFFYTVPCNKVTTHEIFTWAAENGYRPATIEELLSFYNKFQLTTGTGSKDIIVALGSPYTKTERILFPYYKKSNDIYRGTIGLENPFGWWHEGWDNQRFLMVKNHPVNTGNQG